MSLYTQQPMLLLTFLNTNGRLSLSQVRASLRHGGYFAGSHCSSHVSGKLTLSTKALALSISAQTNYTRPGFCSCIVKINPVPFWDSWLPSHLPAPKSHYYTRLMSMSHFLKPPPSLHTHASKK